MMDPPGQTPQCRYSALNPCCLESFAGKQLVVKFVSIVYQWADGPGGMGIMQGDLRLIRRVGGATVAGRGVRWLILVWVKGESPFGRTSFFPRRSSLCQGIFEGRIGDGDCDVRRWPSGVGTGAGAGEPETAESKSYRGMCESSGGDGLCRTPGSGSYEPGGVQLGVVLASVPRDLSREAGHFCSRSPSWCFFFGFLLAEEDTWTSDSINWDISFQ